MSEEVGENRFFLIIRRNSQGSNKCGERSMLSKSHDDGGEGVGDEKVGKP